LNAQELTSDIKLAHYLMRGLQTVAETTVGSSYQQNPVADHGDAIVIASGTGGLAAAALLAKHGGKRVLVLEPHPIVLISCAGRLYCRSWPGHSFVPMW
jgi:NADPH-dependent 2,4-dienoyl-CoA reductase/sulfur reductase-like enzyme